MRPGPGARSSSANPTPGIQRGGGSDVGFFVEGVDLGKAIGLAGTSLRSGSVSSAGVHDRETAAQTGGSRVGYQPPPTPRRLHRPRATVEQELLGRRLTMELGITHPNGYHALGNCRSIDGCCRDLLSIDAGLTTPLLSVPGGDVSDRPSPTSDVGVGAFALAPGTGASTGYDLGAERPLPAPRVIGPDTPLAKDL